jgi:hypothetical protein
MAFGGMFCIPDYFEDESGQEMSYERMGFVLSGDPQARLFPPGIRPHDVELCLAEKPDIHVERISLSPDKLNILGYFTRDLHELLATALYKNGPGSLSKPGSWWVLKTAASDEEIRSFVTIFRRLYMQNEPANFSKAATIYATALTGHPIAKWIQANVIEYDNAMEQAPDSISMFMPNRLPFTRKRLIDVYLYTQYAHQPNPQRARQYSECLAAVGGSQPLLMWLFLTQILRCAHEIGSAGSVIADFYALYSQSHNNHFGVLASVRTDVPGLGTLEKKDDQEARVLREKAEELARVLWDRAGRPQSGQGSFVNIALEQLKATLGLVNNPRG